MWLGRMVLMTGDSSNSIIPHIQWRLSSKRVWGPFWHRLGWHSMWQIVSPWLLGSGFQNQRGFSGPGFVPLPERIETWGGGLGLKPWLMGRERVVWKGRWWVGALVEDKGGLKSKRLVGSRSVLIRWGMAMKWRSKRGGGWGEAEVGECVFFLGLIFFELWAIDIRIPDKIKLIGDQNKPIKL